MIVESAWGNKAGQMFVTDFGDSKVYTLKNKIVSEFRLPSMWTCIIQVIISLVGVILLFIYIFNLVPIVWHYKS